MLARQETFGVCSPRRSSAVTRAGSTSAPTSTPTATTTRSTSSTPPAAVPIPRTMTRRGWRGLRMGHVRILLFSGPDKRKHGRPQAISFSSRLFRSGLFDEDHQRESRASPDKGSVASTVNLLTNAARRRGVHCVLSGRTGDTRSHRIDRGHLRWTSGRLDMLSRQFERDHRARGRTL